MPCGDTIVNNGDVNTKLSQTVNSGHGHSTSDMCSPFCICQCCHTSATYFQLADLKLDITNISTQYFFRHIGAEEDFTISILQPPRV